MMTPSARCAMASACHRTYGVLCLFRTGLSDLLDPIGPDIVLTVAVADRRTEGLERFNLLPMQPPPRADRDNGPVSVRFFIVSVLKFYRNIANQKCLSVMGLRYDRTKGKSIPVFPQ